MKPGPSSIKLMVPGRPGISRLRTGATTFGADISEDEREVTLQPSVPSRPRRPFRSSVRMGAETVTEDHEVSETLRTEQIDEPVTDSR